MKTEEVQFFVFLTEVVNKVPDLGGVALTTIRLKDVYLEGREIQLYN